MGWFTGREFLVPERDTDDVARRTFRRIEAERKRIEDEKVRLSQANINHLNDLQAFLARKAEAELEVQRAARRFKVAPSKVAERDHKAAISRLFNLSQRVARLQAGIGFSSRLIGTAQKGQRGSNQGRAKPSGGDRRYFDFGAVGRTVFGTEAFTRVEKLDSARRVFLTPHLTIPCIQRAVRKEVLFARGHGGKGHRVKHRRSVFSNIGC